MILSTYDVQIKADDQAIQTILLGLPEDIYAAIDSCETAQEIWLRVQQMMKGSDIGIHEKKAKLFNEWERFTSNEGESIESYYHRFLKLMNDLKRNKHFLEKIASNIKFLNNLQPEWSRHVTIVHQTKDLHTTDYTQLYDFLKYNQKEVDELKAERLAKIQDPLTLMANSNNPYAFPAPRQDQPSFNQNYMQQPMPNPKDIIDPTTAMNMALALMAKAFKLNYSTPTNNNQMISSNPRNRQIGQPSMNMGQERQMQMVGDIGGNQFRQYAGQNAGNLTGYNDFQNMGNQNGNGNLVATRAEANAAGHNGNQIRCYNYRGVGHFARNYTVRPRRRDAAYLQTHLLIAQKEEAGIQLQAEEFDLMAAVADLDKIKEVNANCILMANLQQASTLGTQSDKAPVYDSDGSAEVHDYENCDDNEIFNMFTQEEQYTELLEPIPDQHQVPPNDNNVIYEVTSVEQGRETVEQHPAKFEETRALYDSLYQNLAIEVEKVNSRELQEMRGRVATLEQERSPKFVGDFKSLAKEADESLAKQKALELEIERLLRAVGSQDIMSVVQKTSVVDTSDLQTELERTKELFENCIIKKENEYAKLWNDWYKKFTSNSVSTPQESKGVNNDKVISSGMFRINPFKTSKEEKLVPNTVRASARTKPINVSQLHVFTKKDVNSDSNSLSSTGVDNTKTRRPQPRSNTKHDRVPSASKSSQSKNKEAKVKEHHRNLLLSKNTKHMLSACLPKFKYHKEHLCPSCEQRKSKRASHPLKPVPNSRQRLHFLHMDLCGPMRITSINGKRKLDISFLHVFGALCYPKNDREDIGKLGAKGDIGFFIGYSADSCAYRIFNRRTKKIMETMHVSFDELSAMAFEQHSLKPGL
nr:integrase, catalytic region, zinc finger, CCHC-type, peptidase aspartic, catalytic [Tanacetum cinerariifolium]